MDKEAFRGKLDLIFQTGFWQFEVSTPRKQHGFSPGQVALYLELVSQ